MRHLLCAAVVCLSASGLRSHALEGNLPKEKATELAGLTYTEICAGQWVVRDIVRDFNKWDKVKIGIDQRLVQGGRNVTDFKVEGINPINCCEALAKKLSARLFVIREFLYIAPELPPGMPVPGGGHDAAPPKAADPDASKSDPPPPPAAGNGGKPPTGNGANKGSGGKPPPPAGAAKPAVADKPLTPLRPMTPGYGLAEFPAVFPGITPGTSHIIAWSHKSLKACVSDGLPIVLLAYYTAADPKLMTPDETKIQARLDKDCKDAAEFFETLILEDPEVTAELKGKVNFIVIPSTEPADSWPSSYNGGCGEEGRRRVVSASENRRRPDSDLGQPQSAVITAPRR